MLRTVLVLALLLFASVAHAQKRVALVIGNSAYKNAPVLGNPKNDASDVAAALKTLGLEVVEGFDLDKVSFDRKIRDFAATLQDASVGVFYYAGHGLQVGGQNYLAPVDAQLTTAAALEFEMVRLDVIHRVMERSSTTNILFLDACRDNPLARNLARAMGTRSADVGRGLALVESGVGTLISFSTQPGNVALDGAGRNSPFSGALAKHLLSPRHDLSAILIEVRNDVLKETQRKQVPWEHSALTARFYFKEGSPQAQDEAEVMLVKFFLSPDALPGPGETSDQVRIARLKRLVSSLKPNESDYILGHWLLGVWDGEVKGLKSKDGSQRTMTIGAVKKDGSVLGGWAAAMHKVVGQGATIRIAGDRVSVTTQFKTAIALQRSGKDRLEGNFVTINGNAYPIALTRK